MTQVVSSESEQPREKGKQADVRGELRRRIPAVARAHRYCQVASGYRGRKAVGEPNPRDHRIEQRLRAGTDENSRPGAARLDLSQREVIAGIGKPRQARAGD